MKRFDSPLIAVDDSRSCPAQLDAVVSPDRSTLSLHETEGAANPDTGNASQDLRVVQWAILVTVLVAAFGIVSRLGIMISGLARPRASNIFFRLYALHEQPFLYMLVIAALALVIAVRMRRRVTAALPTPLAWRLPLGYRMLAVLATVVFIVTLAATHLVMHKLLFSMDEFSADFQARIFAAGSYAASLPSAWRPIAHTIIPIFVEYRPDSGSWLSMYLPGYALLKAPFVALGAAEVLNPLLAALTVLALGGAAGRLWPGERSRPWLAVALLATSSQFLVTSATGYSMPAHLCLNMVWLWLYLHGGRWSWIAALAVGILALGLHNPFPHALFVAPFLVRLLRERRWHRLTAAAVAYGAGSVMWFAWLRFSYPVAHAGGGNLLALFAMPGAMAIWINLVSLSLLFTWQAPIFGFLVVVALFRARRLGAPLADLAWGILLTLVFFLFFPSSQGHGWGHRYVYQLLGSLSLLAASGIEPIRTVMGVRRFQLVVAGSLLVAMLVQLPTRLLQTERFVRPFAAGQAYMRSRHADVVLVHADSIWYGRDLIRNDPYLRGQPVVVRADWLTSAQRSALELAHPGRVVEVRDGDLLRLGMTRWTVDRR